MPTDFVYITSKEAVEKGIVNSLDKAESIAADDSLCDCGAHVWRYAQTGLCFSCTTGESDASEDYEIGLPY